MRTLVRNLRYGLRMLRKNPGLTAAVVATLMLGIGATTAIYTVVYSVLLAPLPYPQPDQLVMVWSKVNGGDNGMSAGDFLDWREQSKTFQQMAAFTGGSFNLATQDQPESVDGMRCTPGWFSMQGIPFLMGRAFFPRKKSRAGTIPSSLPIDCGTGWGRIAGFSGSRYGSTASPIPWWECWHRVWGTASPLKWPFRSLSGRNRSIMTTIGC